MCARTQVVNIFTLERFIFVHWFDVVVLSLQFLFPVRDSPEKKQKMDQDSFTTLWINKLVRGASVLSMYCADNEIYVHITYRRCKNYTLFFIPIKPHYCKLAFICLKLCQNQTYFFFFFSIICLLHWYVLKNTEEKNLATYVSSQIL